MIQNNAVVLAYLRKSDEDKHGQVQSIEKQREWAVERARQEGDAITHYFEDVRTAKEPGRKGFAEMLAFIEKSPTPVKLYAWKTSRLARNGIDEGAIKYAITRQKIAHIVTRDRSYDESTNHILLGVDFGEATQFSLDLSKDVKEGMLQKVEKGYRPQIALNGWLNDPAGKQGERKIFVDPERFPILQREAYKILNSKGGYSVADSFRTLRAIGFKTKRGSLMSKSVLHALFTNPFICAQYQWGGEWREGKWKRMVSPDEFKILQEFITGNRTRMRKHHYAYNGLIRCAECGCGVTTEPPKVKRQKNGNVHTYHYMRCTKKRGKCSQKCIRVEKMEGQVSSVLEEITLESGLPDFCLNQVNEDSQVDKGAIAKQRELLQKRYNENETKITSLTEKYSLDKVDDDIYGEMISQYKLAKFQLAQELKKKGGDSPNQVEELEEDMEFANEALQKFELGGPCERKDILNQLGSNLWLVDGNLLIDLKASFIVMSQCNRLKTTVEPRKTTQRAAKGLYSSRWYTFSDIIRTYLKARVWMQVNEV